MKESFKNRIGWREWLALPVLEIDRIKAKVDTGARSSALHAVRVETYDRNGITFVSFDVHPLQRDAKTVVHCNARLVEYRQVKSSVGQLTRRPVIETDVILMDQRWKIELTLVNRELMGFRMLLGREAVRRRFLVDAGKSYIGGTQKRRKADKPKTEQKAKMELPQNLQRMEQE